MTVNVTVGESKLRAEEEEEEVEVLCRGGGVCVAVTCVWTRVAQPEPSRESGAVAKQSGCCG